MAEQLKQKGNAAFKAGKFREAVAYFSEALAIDPTNHVLYSNRSAAFAQMHMYEDALKDGELAVNIKPDWAKGYSRVAVACFALEQWDEAVIAYMQGLELDPCNESMRNGLTDALHHKQGRDLHEANQVKEAHEKIQQLYQEDYLANIATNEDPVENFNTRPVENWNVEHVVQFLHDLELHHLADKFRENGINGNDLLSVSDEDFRKEIGMNKLQLRKLRNGVAEFRSKQKHPERKSSLASFLTDASSMYSQDNKSVDGIDDQSETGSQYPASEKSSYANGYSGHAESQYRNFPAHSSAPYGADGTAYSGYPPTAEPTAYNGNFGAPPSFNGGHYAGNYRPHNDAAASSYTRQPLYVSNLFIPPPGDASSFYGRPRPPSYGPPGYDDSGFAGPYGDPSVPRGEHISHKKVYASDPINQPPPEQIFKQLGASQKVPPVVKVHPQLKAEASWATKLLQTLTNSRDGVEKGSASGNLQRLKTAVAQATAVGLFEQKERGSDAAAYTQSRGFLVGNMGWRDGQPVWTAPCFYEIKSGLDRAGLHNGYQDIATCFIVNSAEAFRKLAKGKPVLGMDIPIRIGLHMPMSMAGKEAYDPLLGDMVIYSVKKGQQVDLNLGGGRVSLAEENFTYYGRGASAERILSGKVPQPEEFSSAYQMITSLAVAGAAVLTEMRDNGTLKSRGM